MADERSHDAVHLCRQAFGGDGLGFQTEQREPPGVVVFFQKILVVELPGMDLAEPGLVFERHIFSGGDGVAGRNYFFPGQLVWVDEFGQADVFHAVESEVIDESLLDDPARRVIVNDGEEVEGTLEIDLGVFHCVDEVFGGENGGLAAKRHDRDAVFGLEVEQEFQVADFFGDKDDVGVGAEAPVVFVFVSEPNVFVAEKLVFFDHRHDLVAELGVLVGLRRQGAGAGEGGFDVHVPEGADQFTERFFLSLLNTFPQLPDNVAHEAGDVNAIFVGAFFEVRDQPVIRLVVNKFVEVANAGFFEAGGEWGKRHGLYFIILNGDGERQSGRRWESLGYF